jgi:hypothetical protein
MTVKEIIVTGGMELSKRRAGTRRRGVKVGGDSSGAMMQMAAGSTGSINVSKLVGSDVANASYPMPLADFGKSIKGGAALPYPANQIEMPAKALAPNPTTGIPLGQQLGSAVAQATNEVAQKGGVMTIKVELKKNPTHKKVHLNPKKGTVQVHKKDKTRKHRKITLGLVGMQKRITHARKIHKKMKEMPISELKAELIKRGLVKSTTKAPESVLRQIAADAHIVARQDL